MNPNDPIRVKRTHKMTAVKTDILLNPKLSFGAKGLYALLCVSDDSTDEVNMAFLSSGEHDDFVDELVKHELVTLRDDSDGR